MRKIEALEKASGGDQDAVIINEESRIAFLYSASSDEFAYKIQDEDGPSSDSIRVTEKLNQEGWEVLIAGPLLRDFKPEYCLWNEEEFIEIDDMQAFKILKLADSKGRKIEARFRDYLQDRWSSGTLIELHCPNYYRFVCESNHPSRKSPFRYCKVHENWIKEIEND